MAQGVDPSCKSGFSEYQPNPQFGYHPPPQAGYQPPPQPVYQPPPQYGPPTQPLLQPPAQQSSNVVVVQQQPQQPAVITTVSHPVRDHFYTLSLVMVILSIFCGLGYLVCTLPALLIAASAREDDRFGNMDSARTKGHVALGLNIAAVVGWVFFTAAIIIGFAAALSNAR